MKCKWCEGEIPFEKWKKHAVFCNEKCRFKYHNETKRHLKNILNKRVKDAQEKITEKVEE